MGKPVTMRKVREFKDPLFMYRLMRVKMMISYYSCVKDVSLKELFLSTILLTYEEAQEEKNIYKHSKTDFFKPKGQPFAY